jgi:hypothetical protein
VLVSKPVAALVGLDSSVNGRQAADFAVTDGVLVHTTDAFTPDLIMDGSLGMPFLRHWLSTLDLQSGTGWIAPGDGSARRPLVDETHSCQKDTYRLHLMA